MRCGVGAERLNDEVEIVKVMVHSTRKRILLVKYLEIFQNIKFLCLDSNAMSWVLIITSSIFCHEFMARKFS